MSDLTSRSKQAVIDALNKKRIETMEKGKDVNLIWECLDVVAQLPSVQPERNFLSGLTPEEQYNKINWLLHDYGMQFTDTRHAVIDWLEKYSAQPERKKGKWIQNENGTWSCDQCHSWIPDEQHYYAKYCLCCGSKMEGGAEWN